MLGNVIQIKSRTAICVNVSLKIKKIHLCKNDCVWNPSIRFCKIDEYLKSIIIDSILTCDKVIEKVTFRTTTQQKLHQYFLTIKKQTAKWINSIFYYFYYRIRHGWKQKQTLSYYHKRNILKEIDMNNIIQKWIVMIN